MNKRALKAIENEVFLLRDNLKVLGSEDGMGWEFRDRELVDMYMQLLHMGVMLEKKIKEGSRRDADQGRATGCDHSGWCTATRPRVSRSGNGS